MKSTPKTPSAPPKNTKRYLILALTLTVMLLILTAEHIVGWHRMDKILSPTPPYITAETPDQEDQTAANPDDAIAPTFIDYPEIIHITKGTTDLDLLSGVTAHDNSGGLAQLSLAGNYDPHQLGTYQLELIATDSAGNQAAQPLTIVITPDYVVGGKRVWQGHFTTSKDYPVEIRDGITYVNGILIANKANPVPANYAPGVTPDTTNAFEQMRQAAAKDGYNLTIQSGFRSYSTQAGLYSYYVNRDGFTAAETYSSRAGYSEHQTGLALDLNWVDNDFVYTPEAKWLNDNAYKYGFILRYLEGKENLTGFMYEPWHFRYVDPELAKTLYNNGNWISVEEYFGIHSVYDETGTANF